jgi:hypothetical protein
MGDARTHVGRSKAQGRATRLGGSIALVGVSNPKVGSQKGGDKGGGQVLPLQTVAAPWRASGRGHCGASDRQYGGHSVQRSRWCACRWQRWHGQLGCCPGVVVLLVGEKSKGRKCKERDDMRARYGSVFGKTTQSLHNSASAGVGLPLLGRLASWAACASGRGCARAVAALGCCAGMKWLGPS